MGIGKIKIVSSSNEVHVESAINDWINQHPKVSIKDIKFSIAYDDGDCVFSVMIIYEENH